jgi:hypothetical protein
VQTIRLQSAQRESNPHFRHGKAAGYRYIHGRLVKELIVKDRYGRLAMQLFRIPQFVAALLIARSDRSRKKSTGWDSNPRRRFTRAESLPLDDQCWLLSRIGGARTLTCPVKSRMCCR